MQMTRLALAHPAALGALVAATRHHRLGRLLVLIVLLAVVAALVVALVRQRRSRGPAPDTWKPPVDPPSASDA
jgi:hypothetical protein